MRRRHNLLALLTAALLVASVCIGASFAEEVRVMVAIGLLDFGEDCKLLSVGDFNRTKSDYQRYNALIEKAVSLKEMSGAGWRIVYTAPVRETYHIMILER